MFLLFALLACEPAYIKGPATKQFYMDPVYSPPIETTGFMTVLKYRTSESEVVAYSEGSLLIFDPWQVETTDTASCVAYPYSCWYDALHGLYYNISGNPGLERLLPIKEDGTVSVYVWVPGGVFADEAFSPHYDPENGVKYTYYLHLLSEQAYMETAITVQNYLD